MAGGAEVLSGDELGMSPTLSGDELGIPEPEAYTPPEPGLFSRFATGVGQAVSAIPQIPSALGSLAGAAYDVYHAPETFLGGEASDIGQAIDSAKTLARTGVIGAAGAAPYLAGPIAGASLSPLTSTLASKAFDYGETGKIPSAGDVSQELGTNLPFSLLEVPGLLKKSGAVMEAAKTMPSGFKQGVANSREAKILSNPTYQEIASGGGEGALALGVGKNSTGKESVLHSKVSSGVVVANDTDLWSGGQTFNPDTMKFENPPVNGKITLRTVQNNLSTNMKVIGKDIGDTVDNLTEAQNAYNSVAHDKISPVTIQDLDLDGMQKTIDKLSASFFTEGKATDLADNIMSLRKDLDKVPSGLSLKEAKNYLSNIYETERALGVYDVNPAARAALNPSVNASIDAMQQSLGEMGVAFRKAIDDKSAEIITKLNTPGGTKDPVPSSPAVQTAMGYSPTKISDLNKVYSGLRPLDDIALPRVIAEGESSLVTPAMSGSESAASNSPFRRFILDPISNKVGDFMTSADREYSAVGSRDAQVLQRLQRQAKAQVNSTNFTPIPRNAMGIGKSTAIPDELAQNPGFASLIKDTQNAAPAVKNQLVSDFIDKNKDIAQKYFEPSPVEGYNIIKGDDGKHYLLDEAQREGYREQLKQTETDQLALTKKLSALNKSKEVLLDEPYKFSSEELGLAPREGRYTKAEMENLLATNSYGKESTPYEKVRSEYMTSKAFLKDLNKGKEGFSFEKQTYDLDPKTGVETPSRFTTEAEQMRRNTEWKAEAQRKVDALPAILEKYKGQREFPPEAMKEIADVYGIDMSDAKQADKFEEYLKMPSSRETVLPYEEAELNAMRDHEGSWDYESEGYRKVKNSLLPVRDQIRRAKKYMDSKVDTVRPSKDGPKRQDPGY